MSDPHAHEWAIVRWERAPVDPGHPHHTEFMILRCACGVIEVFPGTNFALTTKEYQKSFAQEMRAEGWTWNRASTT